MSHAEIGWILAIGAATCAMLLCIRFLLQKWVRKSVLSSVRQQFNGAQIISVASNACFMGFNRTWDGPWHGEGILILTREMIYFRLSRRNLDLMIPLAQIDELQINSSGGDTKKARQRYLEIAYRGTDGQIRSATWKVDKPDEWANSIEDIMRRTAYEIRIEKTSLP
jgi:hypothetical protein